MPDERLIQEIEKILSDVVALGGQRERTSIVPNMLVRDASPAGQDDYVIIADNRDNDNILALRVPGVVYADNDLVNVIFPEGGEAIAFQQGSGSTTSGLWDIVTGTDDIYYDKGGVGIGKSVAPDAALEILDTSQQQLRLTFQEDTKFANFTVDTSHNLTIDPSSTGQIKLAAADVTIEEDVIHEGDTDTKLVFTDDDVEIFAGNLSMLKLTEAGQDLITLGPGSGDVDIDFNGDMLLLGSSGNLGIGTTPSFALDIRRTTAGAERMAIRNSSAAVNAQALVQVQGDGAPSYQAGITSSGNTAPVVGGGNVFFQANGVDLIIRTVNATGEIIFLGGAAGTTEIARMKSDLNIGFAVASPQGQLHAYDTVGGWIKWEYDGLDATVRTIIPNGTGDCLYRLHAGYVLRDSAGAVASGTTDVSNAASVNLTVGTNTVRLRVNADGSIDVARTAGTDTIKVLFSLLWL
jgi:hypothetical protein